MTEAEEAEVAKPRARLAGYDLARAIAIIGMVLINFPIFLASLDGEAGQPLTWVANLHFGRAAALFVTLAGAGVALMAQGADLRLVRRTLLLRALFLFVLGNLLILVWSIDILHFYAFYLAIAAIFLVALPRWALLLGIALITAATLAMTIVWPDIVEALDASLTWPPNADEGLSYWSVQGMAQNVFVSGVHPVLPWIAFLMAGLWVGRHDLTDAATRRRLMSIGAILGVGAPLVSSIAEQASLAGLLPPDVLLYLGVLHSPSPLYVLAACGTSIFIIALSQVIVTHWGGALIVRALVNAGQIALTLYLAHALLGVVIPQEVFGIEGLPLAWVLIYALVFSLAAIVFAHLYRSRFKRGPVESLMRFVAGSPNERSSVSAVRLKPPGRLWPYVAASAAIALLALQVVGLPPNLNCTPRALNGERTTGALTLLCPRQTFTLDVAERADVVLETRTNRDLVLELYLGDEMIAQNDDGGLGLNPRAVATLDPGVYRVVARPYESAVGGFVLTRRDEAPTGYSLQPGCSDICASSRDGECDDGGPSSLYNVCTLGTDCADCGPRAPPLTPIPR